MIPALTIIISMYVITRMVELISGEDQRGDLRRGKLQGLAIFCILITMVSCTAVQFTGASIPTP